MFKGGIWKASKEEEEYERQKTRGWRRELGMSKKKRHWVRKDQAAQN